MAQFSENVRQSIETEEPLWNKGTLGCAADERVVDAAVSLFGYFQEAIPWHLCSELPRLEVSQTTTALKSAERSLLLYSGNCCFIWLEVLDYIFASRLHA